jgi:branched-chain amino acid transport system ATP-binding protein
MILELKGIEAGYGPIKVLHGVNITAKKGDIIAIVGPNGSGKSTTIKSIFGLVQPKKGQITFKGKKLVGQTADQIVHQSISYVPQGRMVFQTMTVEENLEMGAYIIKDKEVVKQRLQKMYTMFPILEEKKNQHATFLSGGQQQMLSIARALMLEPELLLLDEPSLGLAPNMMINIFRTIKEINKTGTTIVLVEQNAHMALEICNKAYVLEQGKIALSGGPEIAKKKQVKELYLGH